MRSLLKMAGLELKLFLREPVTTIFTLALPLMVLYILSGVFGNEGTADDGGFLVYRGFGAGDWYTPAYVALAVAGVSLIGMPTHMVEYRETGVLRRLKASSVSRRTVLSSQLVVALVVSTVGAGLLLVAAFLFTDVNPPSSPVVFAGAYLLGAIAIAGLGIMLGVVLPTARAAQSVGLLLWFVMLFLAGAGPPPEVLPDSLATIGDWLPLTPIVELLQEPWLTGEWAAPQSLVALGMLVVSVGLARWAFRWE